MRVTKSLLLCLLAACVWAGCDDTQSTTVTDTALNQDTLKATDSVDEVTAGDAPSADADVTAPGDVPADLSVDAPIDQVADLPADLPVDAPVDAPMDVVSNGCPASATSGACVNASDCGVLFGGSVSIATVQADCFSQCNDGWGTLNEACSNGCIQRATNLSPSCVGCYTAMGVCTATACRNQCAVDPSSATCRTCAETNCGAAKVTCTGLP